MLRVKIAELKDHLSAHLRAVEKGAKVEVMDRNRPIARIVPMPTNPRPFGMVCATRPFAEIRDKTYPSAGWPVDSVKLLLEERGTR